MARVSKTVAILGQVNSGSYILDNSTTTPHMAEAREPVLFARAARMVRLWSTLRHNRIPQRRSLCGAVDHFLHNRTADLVLSH
jgi:hypothetical protein